MRQGNFFLRTFFSLEEPQFRLMWFGTLFSFLGMQMQVIARGYLAYDLTGKNTALGGVMLAFGVPQLLLGLWGGVVADRLPKRTVLWVSQTVVAANSAWIALMLGLDMLEYWMLIVAGVVQGAGFAFIGPARQAFIGDLVGREALGNAVVLQQLSMNSTRVIGPSIAGFLIAMPFVGAAGVYLLTTLGFCVAMGALFWLPAGNPKPGATEKSPLADLRDGVRYVLGRRAILLLILSSFALVMVGFPYQSFTASLAKSVYGEGSGGLGLLSSVAAVGAVAATLVVAMMAGSKRAWAVQAISGAGFGVGLIALGMTDTLLTGMVVMIFVGAAASAFQAMNNSLTMQLTEGNYHGRVQALNMMSWSLFGLASLPLGILADHIGLQDTLMVMGAICVAAMVILEVTGRLVHVSEDRERRSTPRRREAPADAATAPVGGGGAR
ncbi:MAG: MFS transporter [Dehalococcoidia bacterium]